MEFLEIGRRDRFWGVLGERPYRVFGAFLGGGVIVFGAFLGRGRIVFWGMGSAIVGLGMEFLGGGSIVFGLGMFCRGA